MGRLSQAGLHLAMPIAVGLVMGLNHVRIGAHLSLGHSVLFWTAASLGLWTIFEITGRAVTAVLRPWSPRLWAVLAVTMLVAAIPGRLYLYSLIGIFNPLIIDGTPPRQLDAFEMTPRYFAEFAQNWAGYFIFWLSLNLVLNKVVGVPRFGFPGSQLGRAAHSAGFAQAPSPISPRQNPQFMERVPIGLGNELLLLSAQDHYLEVRTMRGSALILYPLGDAVSQLEACGWDGIRIHRSHWVARQAIDRVATRGNRHIVHLKDGGELPVGPTYLQLVRQAGLIDPPRAMSGQVVTYP